MDEKKVKKVKTLADLPLPDMGSVDLPRGDTVLRIPIRAISLEDSEKIDEQFKSPQAPRKFDKKGDFTDNGKPGWYFDDTDPVFKEQMAALATEQNHALVLAGIGIELEGATAAEKWENLRKHLTVGDLAIVQNAVLTLSNMTDEMIDAAKNS